MNIGVLGGGQLAQMLALAGHPLGMHLSFIDPSADACAATVASPIHANYDDHAALHRLANQTDVITYEFENVPSSSLAYLQQHSRVDPPAQALASGQDRLQENNLFRHLDIATPDFLPVDNVTDLTEALERIPPPVLLKIRREGYDGKGQAIIRSMADAQGAWARIGQRPSILEALVPFDREVSILAVRSRSGEIRHYPLTENHHQQSILLRSTALINDRMQQQAETYVTRLLNHLDYVGVLALELFQVGEHLLANEFAPRVHNSGHWTIDGAETSQFENHLRAIAGLPLGNTRALCPSTMLNCIGQMPPVDEVLNIDGSHVHDYGKSNRPGRKVGHITLTAPDSEQLADALRDLEPIVARSNQL